MKILMVGGSGMVGTFISPYISKHHEIKILDINEPKISQCDFIQGSVTDEKALTKALDGTECFINLTMKNPQGGSSKDQSIEDIKENYELNNKGLHMLLYHAQRMGVMRGVQTSTMSVHYRDPRSYENNGYYHSEESIQMDTPSVYGLTKSFGERICDYFCRWFGMNILALRITGPRKANDWENQVKGSITDNGEYFGVPADDGPNLWVTHESDLADAYLKSIDYVFKGNKRFDSIFIAGDPEQKEHNLSKAKYLLNWEPKRNHKDLI
tara:strand:+ start:1164 stop:1967 length:804 start_codon:yes stop_codon:yes gene_type:complete